MRKPFSDYSGRFVFEFRGGNWQGGAASRLSSPDVPGAPSLAKHQSLTRAIVWCMFCLVHSGCHRLPNRGADPSDSGIGTAVAENHEAIATAATTSGTAATGVPLALPDAPIGPTLARWVQPKPQGNDLYSVWIAPWGDVIAVGAGGTIVHSTDNGEHWLVRQLGEGDFHGVWGPGDDSIYVVGERGTVYVSRDRGRRFVKATVGTESDLHAMSGGDREFYIAGANGVLVHSLDAGVSWHVQHLAPVLPVASDKSLFPDPNALVSIAIGASHRVVTIAQGGAIYYSDDRGSSWTKRDLLRRDWGIPSGEGDDPRLLLTRVLSHGSDFLILTHEGYPSSKVLPSDRWSPALRLSGAQIEAWPVHLALPYQVESLNAQMPPYNEGMFIDPKGSVLVVGGSGEPRFGNEREGVLKEMDYQLASTAHLPGIVDVAGTNDALFGVGSSGAVVRFVDGGKGARLLSTSEVEARAVWADGSRILAFGRMGVRITMDSGKSWSETRNVSQEGEPAQAAWGAKGHVYAAGRFGVVHSSDNGTTWAPVQLPNADKFSPTNGWTLNGEEFVIVGDVHGRRGRRPSGALMQFARNSWTQIAVPSPSVSVPDPATFRAVHGNADGFVYAVGSAGLMYRCRKQGPFSRVVYFQPRDHLLDVHAGRGTNVWVLVKDAKTLQTRLLASSDAGNHFVEVGPPTQGCCLTAIGGSADGEIVVAKRGRIFERMPESSDWTELTNGAHIAGGVDALLALQRRHLIVRGPGSKTAILEIIPRQ